MAVSYLSSSCLWRLNAQTRERKRGGARSAVAINYGWSTVRLAPGKCVRTSSRAHHVKKNTSARLCGRPKDTSLGTIGAHVMLALKGNKSQHKVEHQVPEGSCIQRPDKENKNSGR